MKGMIKPALAYGKFVLMEIKERTNFRVDFFIYLGTGFFSSYAHVAIWIVIMTTGGNADAFALTRTIQYIMLTGFVSVFLHGPERDPVFNRVQTGSIARELLYPVSLPLTIFSRGLGSSLFRALFNGLITLIVMTLVFQISWSIEPARLGLFLLFLLLGFVIYFLISFQVDMLAFWVYETTALHYIKNAVADFFSGRLIPLWFYPTWILKTLDVLPFKNTVYVPIAFLIGELPLSAAYLQLAISLFWCCFFMFTSLLLWRAGVKKTIINGG